jgi:hypothetical protein
MMSLASSATPFATGSSQPTRSPRAEPLAATVPHPSQRRWSAARIVSTGGIALHSPLGRFLGPIRESSQLTPSPPYLKFAGDEKIRRDSVPWRSCQAACSLIGSWWLGPERLAISTVSGRAGTGRRNHSVMDALSQTWVALLNHPEAVLWVLGVWPATDLRPRRRPACRKPTSNECPSALNNWPPSWIFSSPNAAAFLGFARVVDLRTVAVHEKAYVRSQG